MRRLNETGMPRERNLLAAAVAALAMMPLSGLAQPLEQILMDEALELGGMDYVNSLLLSVDAATVPNPDGQNEQEGNDNLQENRSAVVPAAESGLLQSLTGNTFNLDSAELGNTLVSNTVNLDVTNSGPITDDVGVNAAAGAFNLQANSSLLAMVPVDVLAESKADVQQETLLNWSVLQDVTNEVITTIILDDLSANVGINTVSGIGNEQLNTFTVTTSF
jgi:hypothetical protein